MLVLTVVDPPPFPSLEEPPHATAEKATKPANTIEIRIAKFSF
jgi:hypothetical protein